MTNKSILTSAALALAVALFGAGARAQTAGPAKVDYLSGGVGLDEQEALDARGKEFNLKVVTAAERSGAFLADVRVKVTGASGATVLDTAMDGPWLLAQLPPGTYVLEATFEGKTLTKSIAIPKTGQRQAYLYWSVPDLMDAERPSDAPPPSWAAPRAPKQ
jgi:hypothetical protein